MARSGAKSKSKPQGRTKRPSEGYEYRVVFSTETKMRVRLDMFMAGKPDPYPGSSNSPTMEEAMKALFAGEPNPRPKAGKASWYPLIESVARSLGELFEIRDKRGELHGK